MATRKQPAEEKRCDSSQKLQQQLLNAPCGEIIFSLSFISSTALE